MDIQIINKDGVWYRSSAAYAFVDPTNKARLEPGAALQIEETEWVKAQPWLTKIDDPTKPPAEAPAPAPKSK